MKKRFFVLTVLSALSLTACGFPITQKMAKEKIKEIENYNFNFATVEKASATFNIHTFMSGYTSGKAVNGKEDLDLSIEYSIKRSYVHAKIFECYEENGTITKETEEQWIYIYNGVLYEVSSEIEEESNEIETEKKFSVIQNNEEKANEYFHNVLNSLISAFSSSFNNDNYLSTAKSIMNNETEPGVSYEKTSYQTKGKGSFIIKSDISYNNYQYANDYGSGDGKIYISWDDNVISEIESSMSLHVVNYTNNTNYNLKANATGGISLECNLHYPDISQFEYAGQIVTQ